MRSLLGQALNNQSRPQSKGSVAGRFWEFSFPLVSRASGLPCTSALPHAPDLGPGRLTWVQLRHGIPAFWLSPGLARRGWAGGRRKLGTCFLLASSGCLGSYIPLPKVPLTVIPGHCDVPCPSPSNCPFIKLPPLALGAWQASPTRSPSHATVPPITHYPAEPS